MNKISINSMFNNYCDDVGQNKKLSIENMFRKINETDIVHKLKAKKTRREKDVKIMYESKYKDCLLKINSCVGEGEDAVFFTIPFDHEKKYCDYSSLKCLGYISEKLIEKKFYAEIISNTQIYISWKNILDY
jgi:hypothetical protein